MSETPYTSDHDILISLNTKIDRVELDIKEIKDNTAARLALLENNKMDKAEAEKLWKDAQSTHKEMKKDIDFVKKFVYMVSGAFAAVEAYFKFLK